MNQKAKLSFVRGGNYALDVGVSLCTTPVLTNEISMFKLTTEEHLEIYQLLIEAKFSSPNPTKSIYFSLGNPVVLTSDPRKCSPKIKSSNIFVNRRFR